MTSSKDKKASTTVHRSKKLSFSIFPPSITCQSDTKISGDPSDANTRQMMDIAVSDGTSGDQFAMGALLLGFSGIGIAAYALSGKKRASDTVDMIRVDELKNIYSSTSYTKKAEAIASNRYTQAEHKIAKQEVEKAKEQAEIELERVRADAAEAALADLKKSMGLSA